MGFLSALMTSCISAEVKTTGLVKPAAEGEQPAPPLIVPQWESATWQPTGEAGRFGPAEKEPGRPKERKHHQGQHKPPPPLPPPPLITQTRAEPQQSQPGLSSGASESHFLLKTP
ncbi:Hypothetical predicted protein [Scomber scombrus]|uniref:Uncharacterized protein n=1 Tax=Scomber scombrus TaxID=13677 RepID=A0AAV1Q009_SCOSC